MTVQPPSSTPAELFTGDISGLFYDGETTPRPATVTVRDGVIANIADDGDKGSAESWDGPVIVPGFIDLHNHGGAGGGFPTGTVGECTDAALYHRERGSTTLWASMVSAPGAELVAQAELLAGLAEQGLIDGIHMEGPFISACRCGAQNPANIIDGDPHMFAEVIAAGRGYLKSITFAPETANSDEIFKLCAEHGIVASLGHTDADFATMADGIERGRAIGATVTATHLFNAMPQIHHRDPGAAAALISAGAHRDIGLEVIADGVHLDDGTVDMVLNAAPHNAFAITDAMAAAGKPDGEYVLGALGVTVVGGVARLTDGGAIAGGTSTLAEQFARRVNRGASIEQASAFATGNAAKIAGKTGTLRVGDQADLVVFAKCGDATPEVSIVAGRAMHPR
ncbi:MAG: amidohydrolase family protein [Corynebacterium casei]|uniref:N-acetylglucosamine-6-phosphate deacetylase n=1 Tax=Corynebacterium casei TaxID=160386 RepID=UPI002648993E|nr:amidohydrolase family protein [Corynebacterium casei]MDN5840811.1 amidohydrolase family protein [Corynebacterium casei]